LAEVAYLGQALHWPLATLLDLEHPDRHRLIELVTPTHHDPEI
jgi:hypothetical protein